MNCPRCEEIVEQDARYCGNCGQRVGHAPHGSENNQGVDNTLHDDKQMMPAYTRANPVRQRAESRSRTALLLGILSVPGAIISLLGLVLAGVGLVLATSVRSSVAKKALNTTAIGVASFGVLLSVASAIFGYMYTEQRQNGNTETSATTSANQEAAKEGSGPSGRDTVVGRLAKTRVIETPCFRVELPVALLDVTDTAADNCSVQARDDESFDVAGRLFAVNAAKNSQVGATNLAATAQLIISQNAGLLLSGYSITTERYTTFAGSPAYVVNAIKTSSQATIQLAVVLRTVGHGENVFVVGYASDYDTADVLQFERNWEWK